MSIIYRRKIIFNYINSIFFVEGGSNESPGQRVTLPRGGG